MSFSRATRSPWSLFTLTSLAALLVAACAEDRAVADTEDAPDAGDATETIAPPPGGYLPCPLDLEAAGPRPEHPRPDLCRPHWRNLNGPWRFDFDPEDQGEARGWATDPTALSREISVPFPWQSRLSGVHEPEVTGTAWYAREVEVPDGWGADGVTRVHLVVGAADWRSDLWVNGQGPWQHDGGYDPFRADITEALVEGPNQVVLRVFDPGDDPEYPHGKQGGIWYTHVGGIWQTVYLEGLTAPFSIAWHHLRQPEAVSPLPVRVGIEVKLEGDVGASPSLEMWREGESTPITLEDVEIVAESDGPLLRASFQVDSGWIWDPDDPQTVPVTLRACDGGACDAVSAHFGVRSVSRRLVEGAGDNPVVHVNGRPRFLRVPLIQGYHPDGLMTYPDEATIIADLTAARDMGFNAVRLHIKPEEPLVLHHADRLGLLVDDDMVNLGHYPWEAGDTPEGRARWESTMRAQVLRDRSHPSIIWWTLFNERWGLAELSRPYDAERQAWVRQQMAAVRELAPGCLLEDLSPDQLNWDHVETDLVTWHFYIPDADAVSAMLDEVIAGAVPGSDLLYAEGWTQPAHLPLLNTEFGPFSAEPALHEWQRDRDISDAFRWMVTAFRARPAISGYVFTELYDVEYELNGLLDYDRGWKETGYEALMGCPIAALQGDVFVGTDELPSVVADPGDALLVHPFLSTYDADSLPAQVSWALVDPGAPEAAPLDEGALDVVERRAGRVDLAPIDLTLPTEPAALVFRMSAGDACNYLPVLALDDASIGWREAPDGAHRLVLPPAAFEVTEGQADEVDVDGMIGALGVLGAGGMEGRGAVGPVAEELATSWAMMRIELELAANEAGMPQTDGHPHPSQVEISVNGVPMKTIDLSDDWADARGLLSHRFIPHGDPTGGYGERVVVEVTGEDLTTVRDAVLAVGGLQLRIDVVGDGGVMVYGARSGRYAWDPRVTITVE